MKVLLANKFFFRNGGSEAVLFQERDFLRKNDVEVVDFSMRDARNLPSAFADHFVDNRSYGAKPGESGGNRLSAAINLIHSTEAVRKIGALIENTRPDLVHCHNIYHQLTPSIIGAAKQRGVPVVLTLHDYKPVCPVYLRQRNGINCSECLERGPFRVMANRCAEGSLAKSALLYVEAIVQKLLGSYEKLDAVIAPSNFMRRSVASRFEPGKISVIYNGVDTNTISRSSEDGNYALYMGRLSVEKGIETLLAAHAGIADRVVLKVAGTGPLETELHSRFPNAEFLGQLSGDALDRAIRHASVVVVPSNCYENCPMSVLEAMAYGKPVVASNIGGIPELVLDGTTGLLFDPGSQAGVQTQLARIMEDAQMRRNFGAAGRTRAIEHFSVERHNSALLGLYQRVIAAAHTTRLSASATAS